MILVKKKRLADAQQLNSYFTKLTKAATRGVEPIFGWTNFRKWLFKTLFLDSHFQNNPDYFYKNISRFQTRVLNTIRFCI